MVEDLAVPPVELAEPLLQARFDAPIRPHLARLGWRVDGHDVVAGILAASHQVVVDGLLVETVACDLDAEVGLAHGDEVVGPHHRLTAAVEDVDPAALAREVAGWVRRGEGHETIVGRFPTHPHAITAVARTDHGWETVHTYPGAAHGTVVRTRTELSW